MKELNINRHRDLLPVERGGKIHHFVDTNTREWLDPDDVLPQFLNASPHQIRVQPPSLISDRRIDQATSLTKGNLQIKFNHANLQTTKHLATIRSAMENLSTKTIDEEIYTKTVNGALKNLLTRQTETFTTRYESIPQDFNATLTGARIGSEEISLLELKADAHGGGIASGSVDPKGTINLKAETNPAHYKGERQSSQDGITERHEFTSAGTAKTQASFAQIRSGGIEEPSLTITTRNPR